MNILFNYPWAFAALAAIPVLAAIYLLRNRFRAFYVSGLMLWDVQRRHKQGGLNLDRLQTPLLFMLEFFILLLLALAAAGPLFRTSSSVRRMVVILDDSFSMLARSQSECRQTAIQELNKRLRVSMPFSVTLIRAGVRPSVLISGADTMAGVAAAMEQWQCRSPSADLDQAVALAGEIAGEKARILVISDHLPEGLEKDTQIDYWAVGRSLPNAGFLHAERTTAEGNDRCMLIIGNFSGQSKTVTLTIKSLQKGERLLEKQVEISPSEPYRMVFEPPSNSDIIAAINEDALQIDNTVVLLNAAKKHVRTALALTDSRLDDSIRKVLEVIPAVRLDSQMPDLLITDKPPRADAEKKIWTLQVVSDPNAAAFVGPFIIDRNHPLTEGLDLQGVIWSGGKSIGYSTVPILSAGNTSLLTAKQDRNSAYHLEMYFNPDASTLQLSPNWPILFWNLVQWRQRHLPGLENFNFRLGAQVPYEIDADVSQVKVTCPDGQVRAVKNPKQKIVIETDQPGVYSIESDLGQTAFAANALSADESDLQSAQTSIIEAPDQASLFWWEYRRFDWLLLLAACVLLALHGYAVYVQSREGIV